MSIENSNKKKFTESLTVEVGKGFDERNLRHMRAFYIIFPNWKFIVVFCLNVIFKKWNKSVNTASYIKG